MRTSRQKEPESPGRMRSRSNSSSSTSSPPPPSCLSPAASDCTSARGTVLLSLFLAVLSSAIMVDGFVLLPRPTRTLGVFRQPWTETTRSTPSSSLSSSSSTSVLMAGGGGSKKTKNKKVKKKRPGSSSAAATGGGGGKGGGFGGAALQICPCGSGSSYNDCCGKIHSDMNIFRRASPSDVVRARYSAYARRDADFLIASTHPSHKDWKPPGKDRSAWKETIKTNMYDNFDFNNCIIVKEEMIISATVGTLDEKDQRKEEEDDDDDKEEEEESVVQFIAEMTLSATGEKTSFMETSTFGKPRRDGPWLYREGTIEAAPPSSSSSSSSSSSDTSSSSKDHGEEVIVTSPDDDNEIPATLLEGLTSTTTTTTTGRGN